jgi:hypothetical protein
VRAAALALFPFFILAHSAYLRTCIDDAVAATGASFAVPGSIVAAIAAAALTFAPLAEAEIRLPPLDRGASFVSASPTDAGTLTLSADPNRCARGYVGNTIGQVRLRSPNMLSLHSIHIDSPGPTELPDLELRGCRRMPCPTRPWT